MVRKEEINNSRHHLCHLLRTLRIELLHRMVSSHDVQRSGIAFEHFKVFVGLPWCVDIHDVYDSHHRIGSLENGLSLD